MTQNRIFKLIQFDYTVLFEIKADIVVVEVTVEKENTAAVAIVTTIAETDLAVPIAEIDRLVQNIGVEHRHQDIVAVRHVTAAAQFRLVIVVMSVKMNAALIQTNEESNKNSPIGMISSARL